MLLTCLWRFVFCLDEKNCVFFADAVAVATNVAVAVAVAVAIVLCCLLCCYDCYFMCDGCSFG